MCMMALAVVGSLASLAGGMMQAQGQREAGRAAEQQAQYQNQVAQNNSIIAQRMAVDAEKRGKVAEEEQRRKTANLLGRQQAVYGASGVDITSGSPLTVMADTAQLGEVDALTVRNNARREALQHETTSMNYLSEGKFALMKGQAARRAGDIAATGTMIGSVGSVASSWYKTFS
jgi:hypothetical protein